MAYIPMLTFYQQMNKVCRHKKKDGYREESDDDMDNDVLFLTTETVRWIKDKRIHGLAAIWVQMDA